MTSRLALLAGLLLFLGVHSLHALAPGLRAQLIARLGANAKLSISQQQLTWDHNAWRIVQQFEQCHESQKIVLDKL